MSKCQSCHLSSRQKLQKTVECSAHALRLHAAQRIAVFVSAALGYMQHLPLFAGGVLSSRFLAVRVSDELLKYFVRFSRAGIVLFPVDEGTVFASSRDLKMLSVCCTGHSR
jgi:hypothetical protein